MQMHKPLTTYHPKLAGVSILVLFALLVGACKENDTTASEGTFILTGKTAFIGTTQNIGGVTLKCGGQTTTSAPDGSYELRGVPGGWQILTADGPNCKPFSKPVEIKSNTRYYVYLEFNGTTVSGYVSNFVDGPIQGATVTIGSLYDVTDQSGHYSISDVPLRNDSVVARHPRYATASSFFSPAGPQINADLVLTRDTVVQARITADQYVDERLPTFVLISSRLTISTDGYIGPTYTANNHRHIYMNFDFPPYMRDSRVTLLDGSLELYADGAYGAIKCEVFAVSSPWMTYSLTYNQQPSTGVPLGSAYLPTNASPQYVTILTSAGLQTLLADYRVNGFIYGIKIQAQVSNVISRTFYSTRFASVTSPRVNLKVRF
jgi:hypothetical protein